MANRLDIGYFYEPYFPSYIWAETSTNNIWYLKVILGLTGKREQEIPSGKVTWYFDEF